MSDNLFITPHGNRISKDIAVNGILVICFSMSVV